MRFSEHDKKANIETKSIASVYFIIIF